MPKPNPKTPRPPRDDDPHIRRTIEALAEHHGAGGPAPDYAALARLLRAHREHAGCLVDHQLTGDPDTARLHAKFCRLIEMSIEDPASWPEAAKRERALRRKLRGRE